MNTDNGKLCPKCNFWLPKSKFKKLTTRSALKKYPDGYYWCCSDCYKKIEWVYKEGEEPTNRRARRRDKRTRRIVSIERIYGLSEEDYMEKIDGQRNLCAICGTKPEGKVLCVDHDHKTGNVRGLLCGNCNVGLGNFRDDIKIIESAIEYLKKYQWSQTNLPEKGIKISS